MALRFVRTTDRVVLVHTSDPDVTLPDGAWRGGWVLEDTTGLQAAPGATRATVRPLDALEVVACQSKHVAGEGDALTDHYRERIEAERIGLISMDGLPGDAGLPHPLKIALGSAIMEWSLGVDGPFVLEAKTPIAADASSDSGSGETSLVVTVQRPDASTDAPQPEETTDG